MLKYIGTVYQIGKSVACRKETKKLTHLGKKQAILAALAKASEDNLFLKVSAAACDG